MAPCAFISGDDSDGRLGWASTGFDDSSWQLISGDRDWAGQGYSHVGGMAWYRFKIQVPAISRSSPSPSPSSLPRIRCMRMERSRTDGRDAAESARGAAPAACIPITPRSRVAAADRGHCHPRVALSGMGSVLRRRHVRAVAGGDAGSLNEWLRSRSEHVDWDDSANNLQLVVFLLVAPAAC